MKQNSQFKRCYYGLQGIIKEWLFTSNFMSKQIFRSFFFRNDVNIPKIIEIKWDFRFFVSFIMQILKCCNVFAIKKNSLKMFLHDNLRRTSLIICFFHAYKCCMSNFSLFPSSVFLSYYVILNLLRRRNRDGFSEK